MKKYQIVFAGALIAIFLAVIFWSAGPTKIGKNTEQGLDPTGRAQEGQNDWNLFTDIIKSWEIEYPKEVEAIIVADDLLPEAESVVFAKKEGGLWFFSVETVSTNEKISENSGSGGVGDSSDSKRVKDYISKTRPDLQFEKFVEVDTARAAVFDDPSGYKIKVAFFLAHDSNEETLFSIKTNGAAVEHERIWKSFRFLD